MLVIACCCACRASAKSPQCSRLRSPRRSSRRLALLHPVLADARQAQSADLLSRRGRRCGVRRRADRLLVRARHASAIWRSPRMCRSPCWSARMDDGHVASGAAVGAAVRVPRPADRNDRHGAASWCAFLASLLGHVRGGLSYRADRRDVSGVGHLRLEGGRHGGDRAGAVPGDGERGATAAATWWRCWRPPARRPRRFRRA